MYGVIKQIAMSFHIKCGKYKDEQLTPDFCDLLFREAVNEIVVMNNVNHVTSKALDILNELKKESETVEDRCVMCGEIVPEGRMVCPGCEEKNSNLSEEERLNEVYGVCWHKQSPARDQEIKADAGKPKLILVPTEIINCIARVREFGNKKYKDSNSWKRVEKDRYIDAMFRHLLQYVNDNKSVDEESGMPHLWHLACNVAFLCEMEKEDIDVQETKRNTTTIQ